MSARWYIAASLGSLGLLACTQTIHLNGPPRPPATSRHLSSVAARPAFPQVTHERLWANHFLLGFVGRKSIDLREHCAGSAVSEIRLRYDPLTVLLWTATLGIYTPRRVDLRCGPEERSP